MNGEPVPTLRDLRRQAYPGTPLAVLGHPIGHSLSPRMHNAALARLAEGDDRYARWKYHRFDIPPSELPAALGTLAERGFHGVNLTVPHKVLAFELVADVDPAARPAGAVNTLRRTEQGWRGFNTDGYGLAAAVRSELALELGAGPVVLLGAGGAARGAAVECIARGCPRLWIGNRTRENLEALLAILGPLGRERTQLRGFDPSAEAVALEPGALVINATSAGLRPGDPAPIDLARVPAPRAVFDMIYNPPRTALLEAAAQRGIPAANGLAMLVHQGAKSLEIWSGVPADVTAPVMAAALAAD